MKRILFFGMMLIASLSFAQNAPINFEADGNGATWTWISLDDNATINPVLATVDNPAPGGINTTAKVAKFTATDASQAWALCHSEGIGNFTLGANNSTVKIMVYKSVISDFGVKFEAAGGGSASLEVKVKNTKVNEWEELTFSFAANQGSTYGKIVLIPDFADRTQDNIVYMDNITFSSGQLELTTLSTINFETAGLGASWTWIMAENSDNPALEFVDNPDATGINTSAKVAKFSVRDKGMDWALCHSEGIGSFKLDENTSIVKIMVWKKVISNVGLKFEGAVVKEILVPNTKTNQWEELSFDFSSIEGNIETKIVIIPDFGARTTDDVLYFDNISFSDGTTTAINSNDFENVKIFANRGILNVTCGSDLENGKIEVFNLTGQLITSKMISTTNEQLAIENGFYVVKISDKNNQQVTSLKVFAN